MKHVAAMLLFKQNKKRIMIWLFSLIALDRLYWVFHQFDMFCLITSPVKKYLVVV